MPSDVDAVAQLTALSRHYGQGTDYVIGGGGNTSYKSATTLWVKGSGQALETIGPDGFVRMDRAALAALWTTPFAAGSAEREAQVLAALMAARLPGEEAKRPSVETLLHDLFPFPYVVHTHPTLANALTCAQDGAEVFRQLFGGEGVWIPYTDPGYILAQVVREALAGFAARHGRPCRLLFLENHGVVVAGNDAAEVQALYDQVLGQVADRARLRADLSPVALRADATVEADLKAALGHDEVLRCTERTVLALADSDEACAVVASAFTPDHIVYYGVSPVRVDSAAQVPDALAAYEARWGKPARVVLVRGLGAFCRGPNPRAAHLARLLFLDAVKIAVASANFGGPRFMSAPAIDFIRNWEVEAFRSRISAGS